MPGRVSAVKVALGQRVHEGGGAAGRGGDEDGKRPARPARRRRARRSTRVSGRWWRPDARWWRSASPERASERRPLPARVTVVEVGPRDGLQNESASLGVEDRVAFCDQLTAAGLPVVEVGAFVSPQWVPQMAGSDEVLRRVRKPPGVRLPVLVPNRQGFEQARVAGAREIAVFTAASESFSHRNTNASIDETFARFAAFVPEARHENLRVRGYLSTAFGCPYEGRVAPERAIEIARRLVEAGCDEVSIGDTIGVAVPTQVSELLGRLGEAIPMDRVAVHFHDTRGTALANVLAALQEGVSGRGQRRRRQRGLPVRARRLGQPRHRRPALHAPRDGHRDGRRPRRRGRGVPRARRAARPDAALPLPPGRAARGAGRRVVSDPAATILVVDDLPANRDLMLRRLQRSGFQVLTASSGPEALELVRRGGVDLVLLDIMMPGMTGLDVLRTLRATRSTAALPVVMVTAKTDREDIVEALSLGANDYVTKPVDYPVALARIHAHLRTKQALRVEAPAADRAAQPRAGGARQRAGRTLSGWTSRSAAAASARCSARGTSGSSATWR